MQSRDIQDDAAVVCEECVVTPTKEPATNVQKCVTCPFCKQVVTAILTKETITCPACKVCARVTIE